MVWLPPEIMTFSARRKIDRLRTVFFSYSRTRWPRSLSNPVMGPLFRASFNNCRRPKSTRIRLTGPVTCGKIGVSGTKRAAHGRPEGQKDESGLRHRPRRRALRHDRRAGPPRGHVDHGPADGPRQDTPDER